MTDVLATLAGAVVVCVPAWAITGRPEPLLLGALAVVWVGVFAAGFWWMDR